jgi:hypothetical protein
VSEACVGLGAYVHVFVSSVQHFLRENGLGIVPMCNAVCAASAVCISIPSIHCTASVPWQVTNANTSSGDLSRLVLQHVCGWLAAPGPLFCTNVCVGPTHSMAAALLALGHAAV